MDYHKQLKMNWIYVQQYEKFLKINEEKLKYNILCVFVNLKTIYYNILYSHGY